MHYLRLPDALQRQPWNQASTRGQARPTPTRPEWPLISLSRARLRVTRPALRLGRQPARRVEGHELEVLAEDGSGSCSLPPPLALAWALAWARGLRRQSAPGAPRL